MTLHRKRKYSTISEIGRLKNALDEIAELNRLLKISRAAVKRRDKQIAELVAITRKLRREKVNSPHGRLTFPKMIHED